MGNNRLLVLIDDDWDEHEIFKMAVDDLDAPLSCLFFTDCESAIAHFSQQTATPPGFVFMDFKLPKIDGDQCLAELKKLKQFDQPLVIILSSSLPSDWQKKLLDTGADQFIEKSWSVDQLSKRIRALVNLR